jgi:4'-phosphopantetheinyl transferase
MTQVLTLDLWLLREPATLPPALAASWEALLSAAERQRWQRFAREEERRRFLLVRALLRTVLGRALELPPAALQLVADPLGKPRLAGLPPGRELQFNLSHTRGLSALAVCRGAEVGVDVEDTRREVEHLALARRYFATREVEALELLSAAAQRELFFSQWTLKEAWVKAKGLGLRVPLDEFSFALTATEPPAITLHCDPQLLEDPANWSFRLLQQDSFRVALALAHPAAAPLQLRVHDAAALLDLPLR